MLRQIYLRYRGSLPDSINIAAAADGFSRNGVEIIPFQDVSDLDSVSFSEEVGVSGYICDVDKAFQLLGFKPAFLDTYPKSLYPFLGREVKETTLGEVRNSKENLFVKPISHKLFTGLVFDQDYFCRVKTAIYSDELKVYSSELVKFVSEYRSFGLNNQILDVRRYAGDWSVAPDKEVVKACYNSFKDAPAAFSLDFGVTDDGRTLLIEANDALSLGCYGLNSEGYANMIEARWLELIKGKNEMS